MVNVTAVITEANIIEQLDQVYEQQPVWDGDLLHKQAKDECVKRGLIMRFTDHTLKMDGFVLTKRGLCYYMKNRKV